MQPRTLCFSEIPAPAPNVEVFAWGKASIPYIYFVFLRPTGDPPRGGGVHLPSRIYGRQFDLFGRAKQFSWM